MKITVYTTTDCQYCKQEKDYLVANKLTYEEKNRNGQRVRMREYLEHWEEPMYEGDFIESSCATCHQTFEVTGAEIRNKGRLLFSELGCHGCHLTEGYEEKGKIGPDLRRIKSKVYLGWLVNWIQNPKQYLPKTRMPHYRFSDDQIFAIIAYLVKNSDGLLRDTAGDCSSFDDSPPVLALYVEDDNHLPGTCVETGGGQHVMIHRRAERQVPPDANPHHAQLAGAVRR